MKTKSLRIKYITDKNGKKKEVVLPIKDFNELMEDLEDLKIIHQRKKDRLIKHEDVIKLLKTNASL